MYNPSFLQKNGGGGGLDHGKYYVSKGFCWYTILIQKMGGGCPHNERYRVREFHLLKTHGFDPCLPFIYSTYMDAFATSLIVSIFPPVFLIPINFSA